MVTSVIRALAPDDAALSWLSGPGQVTGVPGLTPHRGSPCAAVGGVSVQGHRDEALGVLNSPSQISGPWHSSGVAGQQQGLRLLETQHLKLHRALSQRPHVGQMPGDVWAPLTLHHSLWAAAGLSLPARDSEGLGWPSAPGLSRAELADGHVPNPLPALPPEKVGTGLNVLWGQRCSLAPGVLDA